MNQQPGNNAGWEHDHALQPGSAQWLRAQWQQHRRWVAAVLLAHKPAWADVDDLLQDVATAFVRKGGELRDPHSVRPWLRTVAINAAHLAARTGKGRRASLSLDRVPPDAEPLAWEQRGDTPTHLAGLEQAAGLLRLASQIPEGYREPLLLKTVQGMSYRQIGTVMGLPESTVETRIVRARKMLRELAEKTGRTDAESVTDRSAPRISMKESPTHPRGARSP